MRFFSGTLFLIRNKHMKCWKNEAMNGSPKNEPDIIIHVNTTMPL